MSEFDEQYVLDDEHYLKATNFVTWIRYYYIFKAIIDLKSTSVLEVGVGNGVMRDLLVSRVHKYTSIDINNKLHPDIVADITKPISSALGDYDAAIIADVLEHIPFEHLEASLKNVSELMSPNGYFVITIPNRRSHFMYMTPHFIPRYFSVMNGFLSIGSFYRRFIKRNVWIDPHHCWEIGDGNVRKKDVEEIFHKLNFKIIGHKGISYVDFWILKKV